MSRETPDIAKGILKDLHDDHDEVAALIDEIMDSEDRSEREELFAEMTAKLLAHARAEQEVFYRRLEASISEESQRFAHQGANEHQMVEHQLQKMSVATDKMTDRWTAELKVLEDLVSRHVDEEEDVGFSCAREDFDEDQLEAMGRQFQQRKQQLLMRVA